MRKKRPIERRKKRARPPGRRRAAAPAASEARFRGLIELSSDWYWEQDAEYRFTRFSSDHPAKSEIGEPKLLGRRRWELPEIRLSAEAWAAHRADLDARRVFRNLEYPVVNKSGEEHWFSVSGQPVFNAAGKFTGYRGVVRRITGRKRAEAALAQSEARFRSLAELSSDWYWEQDAELRFVSTSGRESGRGGITAADHTGRRRWELPGTEIVNQTWAEHQARLASRAPFRDVLLRRTAASGAIHYVNISGEPMFDAEGAFTGYRGIARDVTERVIAEQQAQAADQRLREALRDSNAELERRVAERTAALETAYRELESFSYSVSHDLRSPLGVIASFAGILARQEAGRISEDGLRLVSVIDGNAQRMGHLIDALLELMRTSRRALIFREVDIAGIAGATCRELQRDYPHARIEIGALPAARGDETLIQQVYANLVGNALKFSSRVASQNVQLGAEAGDGTPVYFVRDNGAGFDAAHAAKLFKPFERLHSEDEFPGTGIGLALVQLIVQRHGGRVWAESAPGCGSTFRFTLAGGGPG